MAESTWSYITTVVAPYSSPANSAWRPLTVTIGTPHLPMCVMVNNTIKFAPILTMVSNQLK